jgi:hypothetical protein
MIRYRLSIHELSQIMNHGPSKDGVSKCKLEKFISTIIISDIKKKSAAKKSEALTPSSAKNVLPFDEAVAIHLLDDDELRLHLDEPQPLEDADGMI